MPSMEELERFNKFLAPQHVKSYSDWLWQMVEEGEITREDLLWLATLPDAAFEPYGKNGEEMKAVADWAAKQPPAAPEPLDENFDGVDMAE